MMRVFIACLFFLLFSVAVVVAIEHDPGYLLISYGVYSVETSIWVGLVSFVVLFCLIYGFFSFVRQVFNKSAALKSWFLGRGYRRSQKQTALGLISFIEGNWHDSRKILAKAAEKSETPLLNYLMAARASHELNDEKKMKEYLTKAEKSTTGSSIAVDLSQAEMQQTREQYEQSLATLTRLRRNAGKHPHVLRLLVKAYQGLNDSSALLEILPELKKFKIFTVDELIDLELSTSKSAISDVAKDRENATNKLLSLWKKFPKTVTRSSDVVIHYAQHLIVLNESQKAEKIIHEQLKRDWDNDLVNLYGRTAAEEGKKQLLQAENWLKERNNDPALYLCLGRLAMRESQWEKAKEYLENSLKLENSSEACSELGVLLSQLGEHEQSNEYFKKGLNFSVDGLTRL